MAKSYELEIEKLEQQRQLALAGRNPTRYAELCDMVGTSDIEAPELIEMAQAEQVMLEAKVQSYVDSDEGTNTPARKPRKNAANPAKYQRFLGDAVRVYNSNGNFADNIQIKRRILMQHFPGRYAIQKMDGFGDNKLGKIFNEIVTYAKEVVHREN
jgi:hypothetical protein